MNRTAAEKAAQNLAETMFIEYSEVPLVVDIIERSSGETTWVSVETELPVSRGYYLITPGLHRTVDIAYYNNCGDWVGPRTIYTNVAHWAALPSPPTGRTEKK